MEHCLNTWTLASLDDVIRHPAWPGDLEKTRGAVLQRVFAHDISHIRELNETLQCEGLPQIDLWD